MIHMFFNRNAFLSKTHSSAFFVYAVFKVRTPESHGFRFAVFTANGDEGIRTLDPLLARQVLSQLSYAP